MTPPKETGLPPEFDLRAERTSFSTAREHVGAAGLEQLHILEETIAAGREQIGVTQALRQVLASTLEQQRSTPLAQVGSAAAAQQATLQGIVASGQAQLATAHALRLTIQRVLAQVRETPIEDISGHVLTTLSVAVHQQAQDLQDIIEAAVGQANSLEQIARLEQISAQAEARLREAEHTRSEHDLVALEQHATRTLNYIRRLEREGQTHAAQREELMEEAHTAEQHIAELEETNAVDQREITRLEDERDVRRGQQRALDTAAEQLQQDLGDLRQHADKSAQ
ncbi:hypothetical protein [Deinococcus sp. QL22]|uniref:hypothetical protein n=1 Tax=Deinococcus sp. QL22 TaxID=2939437 RepID=UPI00201733D3|nr:hypothetical protein [Deinococcus sp. QL22]UQN10123.1 hypothetical protein M1R55_28460 [Deinococcus sp. QL22]